jgi:VIT1/CCC1 family predicted Fe2+/Mn2+ transporter/rubrerythrin
VTAARPIEDVRRSLENLKLEQDAIALYDALAAIEKDPRRAAAFRHIARNERRHADIWATRLRDQGATVPAWTRPRARVRLIIAIARMFGTKSVADLVLALEGDEEDAYDAQGDSADVAAIAADEREHAEIWRRLERDDRRDSGAPRVSATGGAAAIALDPAGHAPERDGAATSPEQITQREGWHRSARSGTLRAVIFGVSDGLVSNLSLVMGVAGAATAGEAHFILLAGIAGLLAGAFSMAAGEYISMQSQRELFERQIELERAELEAMPDEERAELAALYRAKGFEKADAERIADRLFRDPDTALDALVREELGLDPDELGSPWGAAGGSFAAFALGAAVPVVPYLVLGGTEAFVASLVLSLIALFAVGAAVSLLTGRGLLFSGMRQVAIGAAAAAVTYAVGSIIGVSVGG